jgi:hypothetical protein
MLAHQMLKCFYSIETALNAGVPDKDLLRVMREFAMGWRFYHRGVTSLLQADTETVRRELSEHLLRTYMDILRAHMYSVRRQVAAVTDIIRDRRTALHEAITTQLQELKIRIREVGSAPAILELEAQEVMLMAVPTSPEFSAEPSDSEGPSPLRLPPAAVSVSSKPLGPELPPNWFVDARGMSRSPSRHLAETTSEDEAHLQETARRLEFRARKAHETRVRCTWSRKNTANVATEDLSIKLAEAVMEKMADSIPQDVGCTKAVLGCIMRELAECYPERHRDRALSQLQESLDFDVLRWDCPRRALSDVVSVAVHHVLLLGAPVRAEGLHASMASIHSALHDESTCLRTTTRQALQFVLDSIKTLRKDIAAYNLTTVQTDLHRKAVDFERAYFATLLRHPTTSMLEWIHRLRQIVDPHAPVDRTFAMKASVSRNLVSLLGSAGKEPQRRWDDAPMDMLHFDTENIFGFAYAVQLMTVRLLLGGIVSLVLMKYKMQASNEALVSFDKDLTMILTDESEAWGIARLDAIKSLMIGFINEIVQGRLKTLISESDEQLVRGVVDRMTDSTSHEYAVCEARILNVLQSLIANETALQVKILECRCGSIAADLTVLFSEVRCAVEYHWEVFTEFYCSQL